MRFPGPMKRYPVAALGFVACAVYGLHQITATLGTMAALLCAVVWLLGALATTRLSVGLLPAGDPLADWRWNFLWLLLGWPLGLPIFGAVWVTDRVLE